MGTKSSESVKPLLRHRAESRIARTQRAIPHPLPELPRLFYELQVHEVELELQNEELRRTNAELQSLYAEKQGLYQALLHELSQPVLALGLFLDALGRTPLTAEQTVLLAQLKRSVANLGELSCDLSHLGKGGSAEIEQTAIVGLGPLLERIVGDYAPIAERHGVLLRRIPTRIAVATAPALLSRIVANMLATAIRRTDSGEVLVGVRRLGRQSVRIEIWACKAATAGDSLPPMQMGGEDDGIPERCPFSGEGLALVVAHRLADALGLSLSVCSIAGSDGIPGSLYSLSIPDRARKHAREE